MGVKTHKPTTPTMRYQITPDFVEVTTHRPEKSRPPVTPSLPSKPSDAKTADKHALSNSEVL